MPDAHAQAKIAYDWIVANSAKVDGLSPSPRAATLVVVAYNATADEIEQADYVCDGTTDDVEINAAIAALPTSGGKIYLSGGTFTLAATIDINADNVYLCGAGRATVLTADGDFPVITVNGTSVANRMSTHVSDLTLTGYDNTGVSTNADGLRITYSHSGVYENLHIFKTYYAIRMQRSWQDSYRNIQANGANAADQIYSGVYMERQGTDHNYVVMHNCRFTNGVSTPFILRDASGSYFNTLEVGGNAAGHGVDVGDSDADSHVEFLQFDHCLADTVPAGYDGFHIEKGSSGTLVDIRFTDCWAGTIGQYGVYFKEVEDVQWMGGVITKSGAHGMYLDSVISGIVGDTHFSTYGTINYPDYDGIYSVSSAKMRIVNNHFNASGSRRAITKDGFGGWTIKGNFVETAGGTAPMISGASSVAGDVFSSNIGFISENSALATITSGNFSVVVTHGLSMDPVDIQISPDRNPTNPVTFWWVDNGGPVNFTINVDADPGASNLGFRWRAVAGIGN